VEILEFKIIDSTNDMAKKLGTKGRKNILIVAEKQTSGRGRNDRAWVSNIGGLYASFVLDKSSNLPLVMALCVSETVNQLLSSETSEISEIKWPNDILIKGKKVAGILCEGYKNFDIGGIGVNVNNRVDLESATTLEKEAGKSFLLGDAIRTLIENFQRLRNEKNVVQEYRKRCKMLGKKVVVKLQNEVISGTAEIDEAGYLIIDGKRISAGDVIKVM
jgi:birA, biotin-[acetyl-CoA-carboxylase] ligase region